MKHSLFDLRAENAPGKSQINDLRIQFWPSQLHAVTCTHCLHCCYGGG